jgi:hypothetical protein
VKVTRVQCGNPACGRPFNDSPSLAPSERKPCPDCGYLARVFEASGTALVGTVASVALTKIHEEVKRHWQWLVISLVLTLASSLVGLVIVGLPGLLVGLALGLPSYLAGRRAETVVREIEHR